MPGIIVGRYKDPETRKSYKGWVEPEDKSWILFVSSDGQVQVFLDRDPVTGAVVDAD